MIAADVATAPVRVTPSAALTAESATQKMRMQIAMRMGTGGDGGG